MVKAFEKWDINENLLQSYRSIFISSQSFMLAVGSIFWDKSFVVLVIVSVISIWMIWGVWVPAVIARHRIVDYYKYCSMLPEATSATLCTEKQYVHNKSLRKKTNELFGIRGNLRRTRIKIDIVIPSSFTVIWVVLIVSKILP